jgi:hypothetical protein
MAVSWRQLALGAVIATALIVGLERGLQRSAEAAAPRPVVPLLTVAEPKEPRLPPTVPTGRAWLLYLVADSARMPSRVAPVVAIRATGEPISQRAAPLSESPETQDWLGAGILLPGTRLAGLGPDSRAVLLELIRRWRGDSLVPLRSRVVLVGVEDPSELEVLLRFAR